MFTLTFLRRDDGPQIAFNYFKLQIQTSARRNASATNTLAISRIEMMLFESYRLPYLYY